MATAMAYVEAFQSSMLVALVEGGGGHGALESPMTSAMRGGDEPMCEIDTARIDWFRSIHCRKHSGTRHGTDALPHADTPFQDALTTVILFDACLKENIFGYM